jgi:transcriptional regulator with XRE-family HTH domain
MSSDAIHDDPPEYEEQDRAGRVRAARAYANLSRAALAKQAAHADITQKSIARIETVRDISVTHEQLAAIAQACRLPPAFFSIDFQRLDDPLVQILGRLEDISQRLGRLELRFDEARG